MKIGLFTETYYPQINGVATSVMMHKRLLEKYENYTHYIIKLGVLEPAAKILARSISTRFCNSACQVIVPTEKVRGLLQAYGVRPDIAVIPTPADAARFGSVPPPSAAELAALRASLGLAPEDKVLLYIGRMAKEKNVEMLLQFLAGYLPGHKRVKLLLVGDGPERKRLEEAAVEYGISGQTLFAGEVLWDRVPLYYKLGDLFINASQSETQGMTYTEALASGLPVVAMADPCLEGVVRHGANGFLFRGQQDFIRYTDAVLADCRLQERMSGEARRSVSGLAAIRFAKNVEGLYEKTIAQVKGSADLDTEKLS